VEISYTPGSCLRRWGTILHLERTRLDHIGCSGMRCVWRTHRCSRLDINRMSTHRHWVDFPFGVALEASHDSPDYRFLEYACCGLAALCWGYPKAQRSPSQYQSSTPKEEHEHFAGKSLLPHQAADETQLYCAFEPPGVEDAGLLHDFVPREQSARYHRVR
jgi:hypothetical protein